jgi:hypothetical protein
MIYLLQSLLAKKYFLRLHHGIEIKLNDLDFTSDARKSVVYDVVSNFKVSSFVDIKSCLTACQNNLVSKINPVIILLYCVKQFMK